MEFLPSNGESAFQLELEHIFNEPALIRFLFKLFEDLVQRAIDLVEQCRPHHEAIAYLEKAVEWGNGEAMGRLAWALVRAEGVDKDAARAFRLAEAGTRLNDLTALALLGGCYLSAWGVKGDVDRGYQMTARSAEQGNLWGLFVVAGCYLLGDGTPQDKPRAVSIYQHLTDLDFTEGINSLAICYFHGVPPLAEDKERAVQLFTRAANRGHLRAMDHLASCYSMGSGVHADAHMCTTLRERCERLKLPVLFAAKLNSNSPE